MNARYICLSFIFLVFFTIFLWSEMQIMEMEKFHYDFFSWQNFVCMCSVYGLYSAKKNLAINWKNLYADDWNDWMWLTINLKWLNMKLRVCRLLFCRLIYFILWFLGIEIRFQKYIKKQKLVTYIFKV